MAYQHDSDGPVVDKGAFRASFIAYFLGLVLIGVIFFIAVKWIFNDEDLMENAQIYMNAFLASNTLDYTVSHSENTMTVKLWYDGLTAGAKKAYEGDEESLKIWEDFKISTRDLAEQLFGQLRTLAPDADLVLMVVNENNHARSLLVYKNGLLSYDVVQGGD